MDLFVSADDRTGACETAGAMADSGAGPVPVSVWPERVPSSVEVVDLASRHLSPADAHDLASGLPPDGPTAHKIDSGLRGNWADELVGLHRASGGPVLLIPALPELGRTCVGGVVLEDGMPIHESGAGSDVRRRVKSSRPADMLRSTGETLVAELESSEDVAGWLSDADGFAVADARDGDEIVAIVERWAKHPEVVLAGTSAVIGAAVVPLGGSAPPPPGPVVRGPILVACGSVHPVARGQLAEVEQRGAVVTYIADDITARALGESEVLVLATEIPVGDVTEPVAVAAAAGLARGVGDLMSQVEIGALVVIGGDSAAAVLGDRATTVHGSVEPGTAWASVDGIDAPVVTRSGGFGSPRALVDLLWETMRSR